MCNAIRDKPSSTQAYPPLDMRSIRTSLAATPSVVTDGIRMSLGGRMGTSSHLLTREQCIGRWFAVGLLIVARGIGRELDDL